MELTKGKETLFTFKFPNPQFESEKVMEDVSSITRSFVASCGERKVDWSSFDAEMLSIEVVGSVMTKFRNLSLVVKRPHDEALAEAVEEAVKAHSLRSVKPIHLIHTIYSALLYSFREHASRYLIKPSAHDLKAVREFFLRFSLQNVLVP